MDKITLSELADALAKQKKSLSKKEAEAFVREVFETIRENLFVDEVVKVKGLGTFKSVRVESRESVHVNTGKRIVIDSHSKITFTPDKSLSDCVNRPFAAFETMILNDETSTEEMERIDDVPEQPAEMPDEPVPEVEVAQPEPEVVEEPQPEPEVVEEAEPEPEVVEEPQPEPEVLEEPQPEPEVVEEPQPEPEVVEDAEPEPAPAVEESPPVVEEEPAPVEVEEPAPVPETPSQGRSAGRGVLWILLLLLIAGGAYWLYSTKGNTGSDAEAVAEAKTEVKADTQTQNAEPATQEPAAQDEGTEEPVAESPASESQTPPTAMEASKANIEKWTADYPQIENGEYWIAGVKAVHVLEKGEDLSVLAKKYYDDKRLISYIIRMNHYTNSQASNLFVGAEVKIPELVKR